MSNKINLKFEWDIHKDSDTMSCILNKIDIASIVKEDNKWIVQTYDAAWDILYNVDGLEPKFEEIEETKKFVEDRFSTWFIEVFESATFGKKHD